VNHAFRDVTDTPNAFQARASLSDPFDPTSPVNTLLVIQGVNGTGPSALLATKGYDDATGVGSPDNYIEALTIHALKHR
jgi:hypothetical protein